MNRPAHTRQVARLLTRVKANDTLLPDGCLPAVILPSTRCRAVGAASISFLGARSSRGAPAVAGALLDSPSSPRRPRVFFVRAAGCEPVTRTTRQAGGGNSDLARALCGCLPERPDRTKPAPRSDRRGALTSQLVLAAVTAMAIATSFGVLLDLLRALGGIA